MTPFLKVEISYKFHLHNLLKIGAGNGRNSYIDNLHRSRKDADNKDIVDIPGTIVKGKVRAQFQKMNTLFSQNMQQAIFGKEGQAGWAHFSNLTPTAELKLDVKTSTQINRFTKTVKHGALKVEQYAQLPKSSYFTGTIRGYVANGEQMEQQVYALALALLRTNQFGGDKSTGFGIGEIELTAIQIGDRQLTTMDDIKQAILKTLV